MYELKLFHHGSKADANIHRCHGTHFQCGIMLLGQGVVIFRPRFQKRPLRQKSSPAFAVLSGSADALLAHGCPVCVWAGEAHQLGPQPSTPLGAFAHDKRVYTAICDANGEFFSFET
jgi:hypothetical protein